MKILVASGPAHPLFFPMVPVAWALRSAGHDVLVAMPDSASFAPVVRSAGLPMAPTCGPLEMVEVMAHDRAGNPITLPADDAEMERAVGLGFGRLAARTVDGTRELVRDWRPDLLITDSYAYAATAAASALHGVPWVKHTTGPGDLPIGRWVARELAPELDRLGLSGLPEPDLVVDNSPPLLRAAGSPGVPTRYVPYGEPGTVPPWALRPPARPRVLVTLGSIQSAVGDLPLLRDLVLSLAKLGVELVVAVGDDLVERLRPLPDEVVAAGWVSFTSVLPTCAAAVHHGGPGTMMTCLANGVPQVIVPGKGKPHEAIGELVAFGAARSLPAEVAPGSIAEACRAVLEDEGYAERAGDLRAQLEAQPSPVQLVPTLEDVARSR